VINYAAGFNFTGDLYSACS